MSSKSKPIEITSECHVVSRKVGKIPTFRIQLFHSMTEDLDIAEATALHKALDEHLKVQQPPAIRDEWMAGFVCAAGTCGDDQVTRALVGTVGGLKDVLSSGAEPSDIERIKMAFEGYEDKA